jgi:diguanylate cyclase (GGDEF)-like protein
LAGLALLGTLREIDFARLLLAISRQETQDTKTVLDQVVADNFAGVVVAGDDGVIRAASTKASELLRAGSSNLVGQNIDGALPRALAEIIWSAISQYRDGDWKPREPGDIKYARGENDTSILEYVVTPSRLEQGARIGEPGDEPIIVTLTFIDITERRHAEARVAYMARFDPLTGLPNHNQFAEKLATLDSEDRAGRGATMFYFDLDRFKSINDTLGRDFGDALLRQVAERGLSLLMSGDVFARLDGDQFVILKSGNATTDGARCFAADLIGKLTAPYLLGDHRAIVGVSVGVASVQDAEGGHSLMKNAENAHRRAKIAGGNVSMFFDPAVDLGLRVRQTLELEMRDALERDEFWVAYQPQVELASNSIVGVEALLRWQHPERGLISPAEFVPVAEDTGLIEVMGKWTLHRACSDAAGWPVPIKVAVNVSPIQFTRGDLVNTVRHALQSSGLPEAQLDLEITESLFIRESSEIVSIIDKLRKLGISFSLDDFGTGYSSLNYLRKFEVQKIKLDRSFITGLPLQADSAAIVRAVCSLAQDLGIRTNAEGVETPEQMNSLRLLGCKEGQGYLFGKPQPASEIVRLLSASRAHDAAAA